MKRIYHVVAYRWGWTNSSQYTVYVGPSLRTARRRADRERDDRGGKYGVAVYRWPGQKLVHYAPSDKERRPHHNYRIDMFQSLGHDFADLAEGRRWVSKPGHPGLLQLESVEPHPWAAQRLREREEFAQKMQELQDEQEPGGS